MAGAFCIVAIAWILVAALGSGSTPQWVLAGGWVVIALGNVWEAGRGSLKSKSQ